MKPHFRKHFGIALGYAGWVRAARIAWMLSRSADTSLHGKADCSGGIPCTTCPDTGPCGKAGCVRQIEHWSRPDASIPRPQVIDFNCHFETLTSGVCLLKRLREAGNDYTVAWGSGDLYDEAADEIERLTAELERIGNGIATDRCDGDSEWAAGVNAACDNHRALVARGVSASDTSVPDGVNE